MRPSTINLGIISQGEKYRSYISFRPALESEIESWKDFKRALRPEDQKIFAKLMIFARIHADAGSMGARPMLSEILFMSFAIEQQKRIEQLEKKIEELTGEKES